MSYIERAIRRGEILKSSLGEDFTVSISPYGIPQIKIFQKRWWLWLIPFQKHVATIAFWKIYCADKKTAMTIGPLLPDLVVEIVKR